MTVERIKHNGFIVISDIVKGQRVKQTYIGYTLAEARRDFLRKIAAGSEVR